jgi:hypothetical protein
MRGACHHHTHRRRPPALRRSARGGSGLCGRRVASCWRSPVRSRGDSQSQNLRSAPLPCPAPGRALPAQSRRLRPALRLKREISATGLCRRATAEPCLLPLSPGTRAAAFGAPRLMNDEQRSPSGLTIASPRRCARSTVVVVVVVAVQRRSGHATARRGGCRRRSEVGGRGRGWERGGPRGARRGWRHSARGCGRRCSGCTRWRGRCGVRAALATALP